MNPHKHNQQTVSVQTEIFYEDKTPKYAGNVDPFPDETMWFFRIAGESYGPYTTAKDAWHDYDLLTEI